MQNHTIADFSNGLAPIVLFVYNRPWHTEQTVAALQKCELATESDLYIFADGPQKDAPDEIRKRILQVRQYIHSIRGFKNIHITESPNNKGLANSVISGVSEIINHYEKVIVVEDDIITHPFFLRFMNEALNYYKDDKHIFEIGGYKFKFKIPFWYRKKIFATYSAECWGWATWSDRWNKADWGITDYDVFIKDKHSIKKFCRGGNSLLPMLQDQLNGNIDSWAIRWEYCMSKNDALCIRPCNSLTKNIGFDCSGVHCGFIKEKELPRLYDGKYNFKMYKNIKADPIISKRQKKCQDRPSNIIVKLTCTIKKRIKKILKYINRLLNA